MQRSKTDLLNQVKEQVENLTHSPLYTYRKEHNYSPAIGEGNPDAAVMFIGEAPGEKEAETGRPFVGAAGRILDQLLEDVDLKRDETYITSILKDRPPENRDPSKEEIEVYAPFLLRQLKIIQPQIIATLGRFAMEFIFNYFELVEEMPKISQVHGKVYQAAANWGEVKVLPLYHPALALYQRTKLKVMQQDFKKLRSLLNKRE